MKVIRSGVRFKRCAKPFTAVAATRAPAGIGTSPITAGRANTARRGLIPSRTAANLISIPFCSIKLLKVSVQGTIISNCQVCLSSMVFKSNDGTFWKGMTNRIRSTAPVRTPKPTGILNLMSTSMTAMESSKASDGFNILSCPIFTVFCYSTISHSSIFT